MSGETMMTTRLWKMRKANRIHHAPAMAVVARALTQLVEISGKKESKREKEELMEAERRSYFIAQLA
jgi:hypothetical protein